MLDSGPDDLGDAPDLDLDLDDVQLATLSADIRDAMLTRFRAQPKPWQAMTEVEQTMCANGMDLAARDMVRKSVDLLTSLEHPTVVARLGDMKIIGGDRSRIEAKLVASNIGDYRDALGEGVGSKVLIVMIDADAYLSTRRPAHVQPDQPDLPIDETTEGEPADEAGEGAEAGAATKDPEIAAEDAAFQAAAAEVGEPADESTLRVLYVRAARFAVKDGAVVTAETLAKRLKVNLAVGEQLMARLRSQRIIADPDAPPPEPQPTPDEATSFAAEAGDQFEATEAELAAQTVRQVTADATAAP